MIKNIIELIRNMDFSNREEVEKEVKKSLRNRTEKSIEHDLLKEKNLIKYNVDESDIKNTYQSVRTAYHKMDDLLDCMTWIERWIFKYNNYDFCQFIDSVENEVDELYLKMREYLTLYKIEKKNRKMA